MKNTYICLYIYTYHGMVIRRSSHTHTSSSHTTTPNVWIFTSEVWTRVFLHSKMLDSYKLLLNAKLEYSQVPSGRLCSWPSANSLTGSSLLSGSVFYLLSPEYLQRTLPIWQWWSKMVSMASSYKMKHKSLSWSGLFYLSQ